MTQFTKWIAVALAVLALGPFCIGLPSAQAAPADPDGAVIEKDFRDWQAALVARDYATLDRLASPDFVQVEDGSDPISRQVAIGMPTRSPDYRVEKVDIQSVQVTVSGDTGQLKAVTLVRETFSGRTYNTRKSVSETWARAGGGWRLTREDLTELK